MTLQAKAPAEMSHLEHPAFCSTAKKVCPLPHFQQSLKKYHFQDLCSFDITLQAHRKARTFLQRLQSVTVIKFRKKKTKKNKTIKIKRPMTKF